MLEIFKQDNNDFISYRKKIYSNMDYIKRRYEPYISIVKSYYRKRNHFINNSNTMVRIIKMLDCYTTDDIATYMMSVEDKIPRVIKQFKINDKHNLGEATRNVIFHDGSCEIFTTVSRGTNLFSACDDWMNLKPIRLIHTFSDALDLRVPNEDDDKDIDEDLKIYEIDLKELMVQFFYWRKAQEKIEASKEPSLFIPSYIYTSVIDEMMDFAIMNRAFKLFNNMIPTPFENNHPFLIIDMTDRIDKVLKDFLKDFNNRSCYIPEFFGSLPVIINDSQLETMKYNTVFFTKNNRWLLVVSRAYMLSMMLNIIGKKGIKKNSSMLKKLKYDFRFIERENNNLTKLLPFGIELEIQKHIDNIKEKSFG